MTGSYESFKADIYKLSGIDLSSYSETQMKRRIDVFISREEYSDYSEFIKGMKQDKMLFHSFISYLTINVSSFFRNPDQWEIFEKDIIPLLKVRKHIKIWSAACSTGEEVYSLAMCMASNFISSRFDILGTDIDDMSLAKAKNAVYTENDIKGIPEKYFDKFVSEIEGNYYMKGGATSRVTFKKHNLLNTLYPTGFDFISCRNVTIYFTNEAKEKVYERLSDSLNPGGILFIGNTEQIKKPESFGLKPFKTFYYIKSTD